MNDPSSIIPIWQFLCRFFDVQYILTFISKDILDIADSLNEYIFQSKATKSTTQTKKETEQKIDETPATEKKNSIDDVNEIEIEKMSLNQEESELKIKGQKISEGKCGIYISSKKAMKLFS